MSARVVELDDKVRFFGFEIGRRIVEGKMAVFANANEGCVDRMLSNNVGHAAAFGSGVAFAIQKVKRPKRQRQLADKPLPQISAERRRVIDREADVFIKV